MPNLLATLVLVSLLLTAVDSSAADLRPPSPSVSDATIASPSKWAWHGFLEADLGVLLMSGGTGLFAGPAYGPFRAALGFYRFDSPFRALGGAPEGFELKVDWLLSADVSYFVAQTEPKGFYVRLAYQEKNQRVQNLANGVRRSLRSSLLGPEVGFVWNFAGRAYLAPRVGALYYLRSPQPGGAPIDVGGQAYDNARHRGWDLFATLGLGITL